MSKLVNWHSMILRQMQLALKNQSVDGVWLRKSGRKNFVAGSCCLFRPVNLPQANHREDFGGHYCVAAVSAWW